MKEEYCLKSDEARKENMEREPEKLIRLFMILIFLVTFNGVVDDDDGNLHNRKKRSQDINNKEK